MNIVDNKCTDELIDVELLEWINNLDNFDIDSSTEEVAGVRVCVTEDSSRHSSRVSMSLFVVDYNIELIREGAKEISYDFWVDTNWGNWVIYGTL